MSAPPDLWLVGWEEGDYQGVYDDVYLRVETPSITHVNSQQTADATGTTVVITKPTGLADGDVMVAHIVAGMTGSTHTPPAGWTEMGGATTISSMVVTTWVKVVTNAAGEAANYTWTTNSGSKTGRISAYRGVSNTHPLNAWASASNATGTTATAPSVTTTRPNCLVIAAHASEENGAIGDPAGMAVRTSDETGDLSSQLADITVAAAGATATYAASVPSGAWIAVTIALNAAPTNPITFVAAAGASADFQTSVVVNKPTGTIDGDYMVMAVSAATQPITTPSGWTLLQSDTSVFLYYVYGKTASSEPSSYTVSTTGSVSDIAIAVAAYRNVDVGSSTSTDLFSSGSSSTIDVPDGTSSVSNGLAVHIAMVANTTRTISPATSNVISRVEVENVTNVQGLVAIADELLGTAGTVSGRDWTLNTASSNRYGALVVLAPTSGGTNFEVTIQSEAQVAVLVTT
jgi:hypothetical protein